MNKNNCIFFLNKEFNSLDPTHREEKAAFLNFKISFVFKFAH